MARISPQMPQSHKKPLDLIFRLRNISTLPLVGLLLLCQDGNDCKLSSLLEQKVADVIVFSFFLRRGDASTVKVCYHEAKH